MSFENVTLQGRYIRLEPLSLSHRDGLRRSVTDGELWKLFYTLVPNVDGIDNYIRTAMMQHEAHQGLAFATVDMSSNNVIGSTRFMKADIPNKRVEIGATFLAKTFQRSAVNTEAKLLMLTHAFEVLDMNRVEFITDYLNTTSRNAILRLGAKQEGILRNHMVMPDGRVRDSVLFSIIRNEWPGVKQNLLFKLMQRVTENIQ